MSKEIRKIVISAMLVAATVAMSPFFIPVGASRCFPVQHLVNVVSAIILGPFYGVSIAFCTSFIRNLTGAGSLLAFPGSMIGALLAGIVYHYSKNIYICALSEIFGTGILGGLLAYPVAVLLTGRSGAVFMFVIPFLVSTTGGSILGIAFILIMKKSGVLNYLERSV